MEEVRNAQDVQANVTDGSIVDSIESKIFNIRGRQVMIENEFDKLVTICDRFESLKHSTSLPYAFTEQGVSMLSAVLKSSTASESPRR